MPTLSIHAKPALISGMDFHQKWTKTKGSHDQIQIQIHKYKYKYTNTNTNSHIQIQMQIQEVKFWHSSQKKKFPQKRPYLWNRWTYIASTPLKSKLLACPTRKTPQGVSNMPWEHRRAGGASFRGAQTHRNRLTLGQEPENGRDKRVNCLFILTLNDKDCMVGYQKAAQGYPRKESRRLCYRETSRAPWKPLSYHARPALIIRDGFSSKMNQNKR